MNEQEARKWHDRREALFAVSLPSKTVAEIGLQLQRLDFERAMQALVTYRKEVPYKGFYMTRFHVHYNRVASEETDRLANAAAALPANAVSDSVEDQKAERAAFSRLPAEFLSLCETLFADWGVRDRDARGWRILCIDHHAGRDVTPYRRHIRANQAEDDRVARIHAIHKQRDIIIACENEQLRIELKDVYAALASCKQGVTIDVFA
jgi:hypothetical protein